MGASYSYAIDFIEREFVRVQRVDGHDQSRRNITYEELNRFAVPDELKVDLSHVAVLFVLDANRDGLFSYDDFISFAMWVAQSLPEDLPSSEFGDNVQTRCVVKLWQDCLATDDPAGCFADWMCMLLERSFPFTEEGGGLIATGRAPVTARSASRSSEHDDVVLLADGDHDINTTLDSVARARTGTPPPPIPQQSGDGNITDNVRADGGQPPFAPEADDAAGGDEAGDGSASSSEDEFLRPVRAGTDGDGEDRRGNKPPPLFGVLALQALYRLLNVGEGYGMSFAGFCRVLSDGGVVSGAGGGTGGGGGGVHTSGGGGGQPQPLRGGGGGNADGVGQDEASLCVAEGPVRAFLRSFIEGYWAILRRLGIDALL